MNSTEIYREILRTIETAQTIEDLVRAEADNEAAYTLGRINQRQHHALWYAAESRRLALVTERA